MNEFTEYPERRRVVGFSGAGAVTTTVYPAGTQVKVRGITIINTSSVAARGRIMNASDNTIIVDVTVGPGGGHVNIPPMQLEDGLKIGFLGNSFLEVNLFLVAPPEATDPF